MFNQSKLLQIYLVPLGLLLTSMAGLTLALLGDNAWDMGSWLLLSLVCFACFWRPLKRRFRR